MKHSTLRNQNPVAGRPVGRRIRRRILLVAVLSPMVVCGAVALSGRFTGSAEVARIAATAAPKRPMGLQAQVSDRAQALARLSVHPEANEMRRRLGRRFLAPGLEVTTVAGMLSIGPQSHAVLITRIQDDDTERVSIGLDHGPQSLTWDGLNGAMNGSAAASGSDRSAAERIALDSADQFILAQFRGASYSTVARNVMPHEAAGSDTYSGPLWNVVRIGEPVRAADKIAQSAGRMFHVNTSSGLIDRIYSQEDGSTVVAEISGWVRNGTEVDPTHITWKQGSQVLMDLAITGAAHSAKQ